RLSRDGLSYIQVENPLDPLQINAMPQQFGSFTATELFCPKCNRAQKVRERLLLVLPSGELHEFLCAGCGHSLGKRTVTGPALVPAAPHQTRARPARHGKLLMP